MKVNEFIDELKNYNQDAKIGILIKDTAIFDLEFSIGTSEGCEKKNCDEVLIFNKRFIAKGESKK